MISTRRQASFEASSLARIVVGRAVLPIVPFWSVVYLACAVAIGLGVVALIEKRTLHAMELKRMIPSPRWQRDTDTITANNVAKIHVETDNVWKSDGFPVSPKRTRKHRILVMGDSFAWGAALANMNDVWWRQLQRELGRRGYHDVEVIAACAPGASTQMELGYAQQAVPKYKPDLLIWGYVTNDPEAGLVKNITDAAVEQKFGPDRKFDKLVSTISDVLPYIAYRLDYLRRAKRQVLASGDDVGYDYDTFELKLLQPPTIDRYPGTLRQVRTFLDHAHVPGFFVTLPNYPSLEHFGPRHDAVKPLFAAAGLPFYDILPEFVRQYAGLPLLTFAATPNDGHPAPISTHFFAVQTANILEQHYAAILGAKAKPIAPVFHVNDWSPPQMTVDRSTEARQQVSLNYPETEEGMLRMPLDRPYVQINLDSAIPIAEVRASGPYLTNCAIQYSAEHAGAHYDDQSVYVLPEKRGKDVAWRLEHLPGSRAVTTIRLIADFLPREQISTPKRLPLPPPYYHEVGNAWFVNLPQFENQSDSVQAGTRSTLLVLENGKKIGLPHSALVDVRAKGGGLFSHWKGVLDFSTSDNTDPNSNGRTYTIDVTQPPPDARRVTLTIVPQ